MRFAAHSDKTCPKRLATSSSMTSEAPPPIDWTRASRAMRSTAVSRTKPMPPWNCTQSYRTRSQQSLPWASDPLGVGHELARRLDLGQPAREALANRLLVPQRLAEGG